MNLAVLIDVLEKRDIQGKQDLDISGLTSDSRRAQPGFLFGAIVGSRQDGHHFITDAVQRGAVAVIGERKVGADGSGYTYVKVPDSRIALAQVVERFYGDPSSQIRVIGITGTNGKGSTLYFIKSMLEEAGFPTSAIGSISYDIGGQVLTASVTTPGSIDLSKMIREAVEAGHQNVIMEVSSHALVQHRVSAIAFDIALFTNFSQDHLDYHETLDSYLEAKLQLFRLLGTSHKPRKYAIINADDPRAPQVMAAASDEIMTFGIDTDTTVRASDLCLNMGETSFCARMPSGTIQVSSRIVGRHNVYNMLGALAVGTVLGLDASTMKEGLEALSFIPGRFERVDSGLPFAVVVDYAHTPDSLRAVLETASGLGCARLITVFGCGGDRDRMKRPKMGEVAALHGDFSIITSDNPRSEDPSAIADEIEQGFRKRGKRKGKDYAIILDRRGAMAAALDRARPGDLVLIAGKGHESYQIFKDGAVPFDDREVVRKLLARGTKEMSDGPAEAQGSR